MNKQSEPLIELLYQEFPNKDPIEIERIISTVKKWLKQILEENIRDIETLSKDLNKDIDPNTQGNIIKLKELIQRLNEKAFDKPE
jgi:aspartyl/asparaginyl-tRNA synthetase